MIWITGGATYIFFMKAGFTFLEAGTVNSKNTKSILAKNLFDVCFGSILYYLVGYGIAYGDKDDKGIIGQNSYAGSYDNAS